ncbi:alpha/beta hydrolase family esterase [Roseibium algae]|uniref:Polyhydroxybutyrate depolymerase n=1 Tax=Roseibium algae TaxID=3123038 RepID=A0ABU8TM38_9HYPH
MSLSKTLFAFGVLSACLVPPAGAEDACGGEVACQLGGGEYYAILPEGSREGASIGAVLFLHGHRGKALNTAKNPAYQALANDLGVAVIAVQGVDGTWSFPTSPRKLRDEYAFFDKVLEDVEYRFDIDRERTLLSGFSSGAFMTWYVACENGSQFAGYAPIAGAFWQPLPVSCPSPAPYLFHVHGRSDTVVPLEGRALGGGKWHQGDVFKSFDVWLKQLGLKRDEPRRYEEGNLSCEQWTPKDGVLDLCLHDGGHSVRPEWISRAWKKLATLKGWQ